MHRLEEKMFVIERIQTESKDELRKEFEDLKEHTKKAEDDLEQRIHQVKLLSKQLDSSFDTQRGVTCSCRNELVLGAQTRRENVIRRPFSFHGSLSELHSYNKLLN